MLLSSEFCIHFHCHYISVVVFGSGGYGGGCGSSRHLHVSDNRV